METNEENINFDYLEVNKIKTHKLDYSNKKTIININKNNCNNILLTDTNTDNILIIEETELDVCIYLLSQTIGTKFKLLITNKLKSLKIETLVTNDKIIGLYKLNQNSNIINDISIDNKLKQRITNTSNNEGNDIIYIPHYKLGLYNGGYLDFLYIGDNYCNKSTNLCYWLCEGQLIGEIVLPQYIKINTSAILTIYISLKENNTIEDKILYVTTTINNITYFNKLIDNNIILFLNLNYSVKIVNANIKDETILYNSNTTVKDYNIKIKNIIGNFIDLADKLNLYTVNSEISNIKTLFNNTTLQSKNIINTNYLEYKIIKNSTTLINSYFNIIDLNAYYNSIVDYSTSVLKEIDYRTIVFDVYNGFTEKHNLIGENIIN